MSDPQKSQTPAAPAMSKPASDAALKPAVPPSDAPPSAPAPAAAARKPEIGGPKGPEPTRYGDWEKNGRCVDF